MRNFAMPSILVLGFMVGCFGLSPVAHAADTAKPVPKIASKSATSAQPAASANVDWNQDATTDATTTPPAPLPNDSMLYTTRGDTYTHKGGKMNPAAVNSPQTGKVEFNQDYTKPASSVHAAPVVLKKPVAESSTVAAKPKKAATAKTKPQKTIAKAPSPTLKGKASAQGKSQQPVFVIRQQ